MALGIRMPLGGSSRNVRDYALGLALRPGTWTTAGAPGFHRPLQKAGWLAGMAALFLTSGGVAGFLTYVGAWLKTTYDMGIDRIKPSFHGFRIGGGRRFSIIGLARRRQTRCDVGQTLRSRSCL